MKTFSTAWRMLGPLGPILIIVLLLNLILLENKVERLEAHPINDTLILKGPFKHRVYGRVYAKIVKITDGDTVTVNISGYPPLVGHEISVRVYGVDTAELSDGGQAAKQYVASLLPPDTEVVLDNMRRGKYFRIVADVVLSNGRSLSQLLLSNDLAVEYDGGTKPVKENNNE